MVGKRTLKKKTVLLDVDDTIINTDIRKNAVWRHVTGMEIPQSDVESLTSKIILEKYCKGSRDLWFKFWRTLLCFNKSGKEFLKFDRPLPDAVDIVYKWSKNVGVTYITGRTENMRELTINELRTFGFPVNEDNLYMCSRIEDFLGSALEVRGQLVSSIALKRLITCVVDDHPSYFPLYANFKIPMRIGLLRSKRYKPENYKEASFIAKSWFEIKYLKLEK